MRAVGAVEIGSKVSVFVFSPATRTYRGGEGRKAVPDDTGFRGGMKLKWTEDIEERR